MTVENVPINYRLRNALAVANAIDWLPKRTNANAVRTRSTWDAFREQRANARNRGIGWHFEYDEWLAWWGDDIIIRGNRVHELMMCRVGDAGDYEPGNVYKGTANDNAADAGYRKRLAHLRDHRLA